MNGICFRCVINISFHLLCHVIYCYQLIITLLLILSEVFVFSKMYLKQIYSFYAPTLGGSIQIYPCPSVHPSVSPSQNVGSHVTPKVSKLKAGNFTGMLVSICHLGLRLQIPSILVELMSFTFSKFAIFKLCRTYFQKCLAYNH